MKTIILNGSPRKNWNTALMLKEAKKGAESVGAETEYIDLYDLTYTGCRSCMACKRKGGERCECFWKDDLSPVIDRIFAADALIIGSPIYLGDITSQVHGVIERLHFCALSYDDYSNYFTGMVNVGIILTMNAPKQLFDKWYMTKADEVAQSFKTLNGEVEVYAYEAAHAYFDYLFNERGARRIYAYTEDTNLPSQHLCEKLGMRREGLFKEFVTFINNPDGTPLYENTVQYAVLKRAFLHAGNQA